MPAQLLLRRASQAVLTTVVLGAGEIGINTDDDSLNIGDGVTAGGHRRIPAPFVNWSAPTAGGTVTMSQSQTLAVLVPAGTLATLTVTLPPSPLDGRVAGASTTQIITALTVNAPGGASVVVSPTTLAAGGSFNMVYRASNTTWYPAP